MTIRPTLYWNEKIVMGYLMQAANIHRRMPEVRMPGYYSLWSDTMKDKWARLYDTLNGKSTLGSPMPPEVDFQDEVMAWLRLLNRRQQQIVWMRANGVPWKILIDEFGRSKPTLWRELSQCLRQIIVILNRRDPKGNYFQRLRSHALCYT